MKHQLEIRIFSFISIISMLFGALGVPTQRIQAASELPTIAKGKPSESNSVSVSEVAELASTQDQQAAAWFDSGWAYRQPVTITNTGSALTDYQVAITLDSGFNFANANSDGSDLRVTDSDGVTSLSFWIERWSTGDALLWVKVPSVAVGDSTLYLYYGNAAATGALRWGCNI